MIQEILTDKSLLSGIANPVTQLDDKEDLTKLFKDLEDTVNARHFGKLIGVGLSAPQIGVLKRVVIINYQSHRNLILVNPKMIEATGRMKHDEMCLSFPGGIKRRTRKQFIKVEFLDRNLKPRTQVFTALEAVIVQHELDHLDGRTLADD